jgi:hypothetical protein
MVMAPATEIAPFLKRANLGSARSPYNPTQTGQMTTWSAAVGAIQTHLMVWVSGAKTPQTGAVIRLEHGGRYGIIPLVKSSDRIPMRSIFELAASQHDRLTSLAGIPTPLIPTRHALPFIAEWAGRPNGWLDQLKHVDDEPLWLNVSDAVLDAIDHRPYVTEPELAVRTLEELESRFAPRPSLALRITHALTGNPDRQYESRSRVLRLSTPRGLYLPAIQPTLQAFFELSSKAS